MEASSGFEPLNEGFADPSLSHLGTTPAKKKDTSLGVRHSAFGVRTEPDVVFI